MPILFINNIFFYIFFEPQSLLLVNFFFDPQLQLSLGFCFFFLDLYFEKNNVDHVDNVVDHRLIFYFVVNNENNSRHEATTKKNVTESAVVPGLVVVSVTNQNQQHKV